MDLTNQQREVLITLVDRYQSREGPVPGEVIADVVGQHPGTIRDRMQSLKALDLVEGIPGVKGGYKPTTGAYEVLDRESLDSAETLVLARDYDRIDVTVEEIDFTAVHHPEKCRAIVTFQQPLTECSAGDPVVVGPTPRTGLTVTGRVEAIAGANDELHLDVARLEAPFDGSDAARG